MNKQCKSQLWYIFFVSGFLFAMLPATSQNVGINTATPTERLDVNGNINVTGSIKANGTDGLANQVLMKNATGSLVWGDLCSYKNATVLTISGTWNVPAGVTRILIEVWGGGGGGDIYGGGAGGTYLAAPFTVTPGLVITYSVGSGGFSAGTASAEDGETSWVQVGSPAISLNAHGGGGATFQATNHGSAGSVGSYTVTGVSDYIFETGRGGETPTRNYMQFNATTFYETGQAGKGGDAGNSRATGATGSNYVYNNTAGAIVWRSLKVADGIVPGGGGGSGIKYGGTSISGGEGARGLIIIRW
jgi:hypothetical protein